MTPAEPAPLLLSRMADGGPEIFASVQGEGASMGVPSTFVRLAICNLRCDWCDTAYTWDWTRYARAEHILPLAVEDVAARVAAFVPRNVVVTGGEPLVQRRQLVPLLQRLHHHGFRLELETNGTIAPAELAGLVDQFNVSPKLAHSGNDGLARIRPAALHAFAELPHAYFKFVVRDENDLGEVEALRETFALPAGRVILMPEGRTAAELSARGAALAEQCTARGYRFSTRLHIYLWGDRRGV